MFTCVGVYWSQLLLSFQPLDTWLSVSSRTDPQCQVRLWPKCLVQLGLTALLGTKQGYSCLADRTMSGIPPSLTPKLVSLELDQQKEKYYCMQYHPSKKQP